MITSLGDLVTDAEAAGNSATAAAAARAQYEAGQAGITSTSNTIANAPAPAPDANVDPVSAFLMSMPPWVVPAAVVGGIITIGYFITRKK